MPQYALAFYHRAGRLSIPAGLTSSSVKVVAGASASIDWISLVLSGEGSSRRRRYGPVPAGPRYM
jgi:hypothetical protein